MAEDTTRLIIQVETLLKGLDKTLRGLGQVEAQLKKVASIKVGATGSTAAFDRATQSAKRLENQQRRLSIQAQELDNRQTRAEQSTQRLAQAQTRLNASQERLAKSGQQITTTFGLTNKQLLGMGNAARSIGQGLVTFGTIITTSLTVPLTAFGAASVNAAVQMDSLKRGLTAIVGSSVEASRQLARLATLAKLPGIGFEEAIQGSIRLQAVGFSAKEAERNLREFANAVALTGGGREELARVTVQLGQLAAKGKVLSQDLRPIIEAAPAVGRALKEAFGTVNADDIAEMTTNSREFLDVLVTQLERLPRAAAGAKNSFENFRDTVFRAAAAVGEALLPALIQLSEVAGPIITGLAKVFSELPGPIQALLVGLAAIVAIAGPLTLILGGTLLALGRLIVGIVQFNAQLPATAAGLFGLATGANAATGAMTVLRATLIATGLGLVGLVAQIGLAIVAYKLYNVATAEAAAVSQEQLDATNEQVKALKEQEEFLGNLKTGVRRTADEQDKLREIYNALNLQAQTRVSGIVDETERLGELRAEIERLLQLRLQEREQQIANIAATAANAIVEADAAEKQAQSATEQIQANARLFKSIQELNDLTTEHRKELARQGINASNVQEALGGLQTSSQNLTEAQNELRKSADESNKKAKEQADLLRALGINSQESLRQFLLLAQSIGGFRGSIEDVLPRLSQLVQLQQEGAKAADAFTKALKDQKTELQQAGSLADKLQKERRQTISDAAAIAREAANDFEGALKFMRAFIAAQPQLRAAIQREAEIQGKSFEEIVRDSLGSQGKRQSGLATAQAQLAKQLEDIAKTKSEKILALQEQENERLLNENETAFKAQLRSYEQYLEERAKLTIDSLNDEIKVQLEAAIKAQETQREINRRLTGSLTQPQKIKLQIKSSEAEERELKALTKAAELETKRNALTEQLKQAQVEAVLEQERNIRQLAIEYANLQGRVESAFAAESEEKSRERLRALGQEQDFIKGRLNLEINGVKIVKGEERARLQIKQKLNQQEIEGITNIQRQNDGLSKLVGAEKKVADAKQEQSDLEARLEFQVKFRGLAEEDAIKQRLAGEAKVRDALLEAEAITEKTIASFGAITPPKALTDALKNIRTELLGLGELDFATKFRLAQKEFDRINDQRIQKIAEVERAVAHRDISELQGRIAIKAANGEYIGALEQQLQLLQQIAAQSGDQGLQKQAQDAANTTAEVKNATTAVADLNTELKNAAIDSARDAFSGIGRSLVDIARGATTAKEALLDLLDQVANRLTDIAFDRLSEKLFGGLLGGAQDVVGGLGGVAGGAAGASSSAALQTAAATAGAALTTGGTTAGAAMSTGGVTAGASITTAGAAFLAAVSAAAAAFAAAVGASAGFQAIGSAGAGLAGAAATGLFPAAPGGLIHVVEGRHPEAILTTDPKYAARQAGILREYLQKTQGLWGRIPKFEMGGWASASQMEAQMLSSLSQGSRFRAPSPSADMQLASPSLNIRNINLIDRGQLVSGHLRSAEGARDILNIISTERDEVGRRIGVR